MEKSNLNQPAYVSLVGAGTVATMADREGWSTEDYVIQLAEKIRHPGVSLDCQRERLICLASMGPVADSTGGAALAQHFQLLEALFMRFSLEAVEALQRGGHKAAEVAERYTAAAVRAQGAALRCLSALKALRDAPSAVGAGSRQNLGEAQPPENLGGCLAAEKSDDRAPVKVVYGPDNVEVLEVEPPKSN